MQASFFFFFNISIDVNVIPISGLLLAYSGYDTVGGNDANATVSAALISNIWETFERQGEAFFFSCFNICKFSVEIFAIND